LRESFEGDFISKRADEISFLYREKLVPIVFQIGSNVALPAREVSTARQVQSGNRAPGPQSVSKSDLKDERRLQITAIRRIGTVKFFNCERGYGFIKPDDKGRDIFVHITAVERAGPVVLKPGQRVMFELEPDKKGKGPKAVNIAILGLC
jgi:CspA family cold shock protein